ncbi:MAG: proline--tRNA ligase [Mariprofundaceae bacterium]|nr:proline--tRNA ligase [Mariprofundaceae bacterium]
MRYSRFLAPTMRNTPSDAEVVSHQLLLRGGFIRRVTSGIYDYLPLGLRVLRNIETIVREEMNRAGAQELLMPMVQPSELWHKSGRLQKYGAELARFNDRHGHESCIGPTHEEVVCDLIAKDLRSYKQLPLNVYQIQTKFRDEIRPRFGLMRGREFIMKDAYSFHADEQCLQQEYENMFASYERIFTRLGLDYRPVEADNGSIGGLASHEFHVLADSGEDLIAHCSACHYAANVEKATAKHPTFKYHQATRAEISTPGASSVEDVTKMLGIKPEELIKTMMYHITGGVYDGGVVAVCVCGDDSVQEVKLARSLSAETVRMADDEMMTDAGAMKGFVGACGLSVPVFVDHALRGATGLTMGANLLDTHLSGIDVAQDIPVKEWLDVRAVKVGDTCNHCDDGTMQWRRGIEVGHVFALGSCYAEAMEVQFQNKEGRRATATMGCYGIGISRLMAAVIEQCHDDAGIVWPECLAPFQVSIISLGKKDAVMDASASLYHSAQQAGFEVLWDDRKERPGVKFRDHELIGIPWQIIIGDRDLEQGNVAVSARCGEKTILAIDDAISLLSSSCKH